MKQSLYFYKRNLFHFEQHRQDKKMAKEVVKSED